MTKLLDLRSFGAIGFQDFWLKKHRYGETLRDFIKPFLKSFYDKGISCSAITSEDSQMLPNYPENRFGSLGLIFKSLTESNDIKESGIIDFAHGFIDSYAMRIRYYLEGKHEPRELTLINSETINAPEGQDWKGIKVHVVGGNCLPKGLSLEETLSACKEKGLITFLLNSGVSQDSMKLAEEYHGKYNGLVVHDANNCLPNWIRGIKKLDQALGKYVQAVNDQTHELAERLKVPGIAVSSSHFLHEIGRAGIEVKDNAFKGVDNGIQVLERVRHILEDPIKKPIKLVREHNGLWDLFKLKHFLNKYGGIEGRFSKELSSYNTKQNQESEQVHPQ